MGSRHFRWLFPLILKGNYYMDDAPVISRPNRSLKETICWGWKHASVGLRTGRRHFGGWISGERRHVAVPVRNLLVYGVRHF